MIKTASELILVWMICASSQGCGDLSRKEKNASSSALIGSSLSPGLKAGKSNSNSDQENRRTVGESVDLERDTVSVFHGDQADRDPGLVHDDNPADGDVKEAEKKKLDVEDPKEEVGSDGSLDGNESESIARGEVRSPSSDEEKSEDNDGPAVGPKGVSDETSDGFQPVSTDSVHNPEQSLLSEDLEKVVARDEGVVSDNNNNKDIEKQDNVEVPEIVKASPALSAQKDKKKGEPARKGNTRKLSWKHVLGSLGLAAAASLGYWALQNQGAHLAGTRTIGDVYTSDKGLSKFDASATDLSKTVAIYREPQFPALHGGNGVQSTQMTDAEAQLLASLLHGKYPEGTLPKKGRIKGNSSHTSGEGKNRTGRSSVMNVSFYPAPKNDLTISEIGNGKVRLVSTRDNLGNKIMDGIDYARDKSCSEDASSGKCLDKYQDCAKARLRDCTYNGTKGFCCLLFSGNRNHVAFTQKASFGKENELTLVKIRDPLSRARTYDG